MGDKRVLGSETVAAVNLSVYVAEKFVVYGSRVANKFSCYDLPWLCPPSIPPSPPLSPLFLQPSQSHADVLPPAPSASASAGVSLVPPAEVIYALVGDAAFGVPFYRSLNNGLICASDLAAALSAHGDAAGNGWRAEGPGGSAPLEAYARGVERLAVSETAAARMRGRAFLAASATAAGAHVAVGSVVFDSARLERWRSAPLEN